MADKYPNISPYAYCAWNPVMYIDPDGKDIFIYYIGPKHSSYGFLNGHTSIGANKGGNSAISYYPASGNKAAWEEIPHYSGDGRLSYTYRIDEEATMKEYVEDGEYVVRMRIVLPKDVEKSIKGQIDDYIQSGGKTTAGDGEWCTLQVKDIIKQGYLDAGYNENDAEDNASQIIPYIMPENPTDKEKKNSGFNEYTIFKLDDLKNLVKETKKLYEDNW